MYLCFLRSFGFSAYIDVFSSMFYFCSRAPQSGTVRFVRRLFRYISLHCGHLFLDFGGHLAGFMRESVQVIRINFCTGFADAFLCIMMLSLF